MTCSCCQPVATPVASPRSSRRGSVRSPRPQRHRSAFASTAETEVCDVSRVFLDPSYEETPAATARPARPESLRGATVGVISNGKAGTRAFFDHLERMLREEWGVADVVRVTKANYSA